VTPFTEGSGLFVYPVIVGGGRSFFPLRHASLDLELVETRSFAAGVVYLRYRRLS